MRLGLAPRGVCLAGARHRGRRCALTAPFHPLHRRSRNVVSASVRDCSLLHVPSAPRQCRMLFHCRTLFCSVGSDAAFPLGSTVPCGVRTFLTADADRSRYYVPRTATPTERPPDPHVVGRNVVHTSEVRAGGPAHRIKKSTVVEETACAGYRSTLSSRSSMVSL